jgi:tetratricopeptide (TPR) repeat protein
MKKLLLLLFCILTALFTFQACDQQQDNADQNDSTLTGDPGFDQLNRDIKANPQDADLYFQRAELYVEIEDYESAIRDLAQAMQLDSTNIRYHYLLGDAYMQNFQSQRALRTMERVAAIYPDSLPVQLKLAEFQLILKQYQDVYKTLGRVMETDPRNTRALFLLGITYQEQGNLSRAKQSFQTLTEIDSDNAEAWIMLGKIYAAEDDPLAVQCYDNAIAVDSMSLEAWHAKAYYLQDHGNVPAALNIYERMHLLDVQYTDAYLNAGILYLEQDSIDRAHREFHKLSKIDPSNPLAYYYLGVIAESNGEFNKAMHQYKQAYNLAPDFQRAKNAVQRLQQGGQGEM